MDALVAVLYKNRQLHEVSRSFAVKSIKRYLRKGLYLGLLVL
jgi:hypothetical protein